VAVAVVRIRVPAAEAEALVGIVLAQVCLLRRVHTQLQLALVEVQDLVTALGRG